MASFRLNIEFSLYFSLLLAETTSRETEYPTNASQRSVSSEALAEEEFRRYGWQAIFP